MRSIRWLVPAAATLLIAACGGPNGSSEEASATSDVTIAAKIPKPPPPPKPPKPCKKKCPQPADRVSIAATAPTTPVAGGMPTRIDVIVSNPSSTAATGVAATLGLGSGLLLQSVSCTARNHGVCPANPASLTIASLAAGGSVDFTLNVLVAPGMSGPISSSAYVTAANDALTTDNIVTFLVHAYSADVSVTADSAGGAFFSGSIATYSMTVANAGPDAAQNVTIEDVLGPGQALSSIVCAQSRATCPATTGNVMRVAELPNGGALSFTVNASIGEDTFGPIFDTLHVHADGDPLFSNNVATISASARKPVSPQSPSFVTLRSDHGDYIGGGEAYDYDGSNSAIKLLPDGATLEVDVDGDQYWRGYFRLPNSLSQLTPGTYANLTRYAFSDPAVGGLDWSGEYRGCNIIAGSIIVDAVAYAQGVLKTLDLRFEQHCEGAPAALRGQIHWNADDATRPPGPVNPPPKGLWSPAIGATPASGNYVYLKSDGADFVGQGGTYTYTDATAVLALDVSGNHLSVNVNGDEYWSGDFQAMDSISELEPGYYADLKRYAVYNAAKGALSWTGEGRGCNTSSSWFVIDAITFAGSALASIDLRFEQHCEGGAPALHGQIHWAARDVAQPPGPKAPPANLWQPAPGATPTSGNYVYLEGQPGDFIVGDHRYTYTQADASLDVSSSGARLDVEVHGEQYWYGNFQGMSSLTQLAPGYYSNLERYPFHNPARGGLSWWGQGSGCNTLTGWFVVDSIRFAGGSLTAIDLRFEQHCEGGVPALHGQIHWAAGDPTQPPGVQNPPPPNLWAPAAGSTPASGNYVYLVSENGDPIGQGNTYTYTGADSVIHVFSTFPTLTVWVKGDEEWNGYFVPMSSLSQFVPGYYGNAENFSSNNPIKPRLSWNGINCNNLTGWFVIDNITFAGDAVDSLDLRFEQHCGGGPALHGAVHWSANDPTQAPGPQSPPPNLWAPAPGSTPASGNYLYTVSDPNDYIGLGRTSTETSDNAHFSLSEENGHMRVDVGGVGIDPWSIDFAVMNSISSPQPGYYGDLQRWPFHNPARGGMNVSSSSRGCNQLSGWVVVDSVTYSTDLLASIDLRFEQHCEHGIPALHGQLHWIR